jgi:large subunit ribosomal protein L14
MAMIQPLTRLKVTDNSGVQEIMCIRVMGRGTTRIGSLGDEIVASAKRVAPNSPIQKGDVVRAVIVRTRAPVGRADGSYIRFDDNAAVLVNAQKEPVCTRVFGPVARELRHRRHMKIISLAPEVL